MRASPAFQVTVRRFGVWQGAIAALVSLGLALMGTWWAGRESRLDAVLLLALTLAGVAVVRFGIALARVPATHLRWDGQCWHLGDPAANRDDAQAGDLGVAIDLGPWMLLCFRPVAPAGRRRVTWLPVQRLGLEGSWHALRCAVYSPRPAPQGEPSSRV